MNTDRINLNNVPPQNIDAERAVLGAMMLGRESMQAISDVIEVLGDVGGADQFYREGHRKIYRAIMGLFEKGEPADLLTVSKELDTAGELEQVGSVAYLDEMIDSVPTIANVGYYAETVRESAQRRATITMAEQMYQEARDITIPLDEVIGNAESNILALNAQESDESPLIFDAAMKTMRHLKRVYENQGELLGIPTGFKKIDSLTLGLIPSDYIIIAGRPSMGKSAFLANIFRNISVNAGKPIGALIFSLETAQVPFVTRMLSDVSGIGFKELREGFISPDQWESLTQSMGKIGQSPIYIVSKLKENLSPKLMRSITRRLMMKHDIGLIAIDYLQLMVGDRRNENRQQEVTEISRELKRMAVEFDVPMVALSQLSRQNEKRPNARPRLSDLRESGAIEQDADLVIFIHRPSMYEDDSDDPMTEMIIAKQRNGPLDIIKFGFDGAHMRFNEL